MMAKGSRRAVATPGGTRGAWPLLAAPLQQRPALARTRGAAMSNSIDGASAPPKKPLPPGYITLSPGSQPIFTFIEAANKAIQTEYLRLHQLWRYDPDSAGSHEEWMRFHAEHDQRVLDLGPLGAEAIRAGRLAGETVRTGELIRRATDCIRGLEGWVGKWWRLYGDDYREWRKKQPSLQEVPPELIDDALPLLESASETMIALTNDLHIIAIAVPDPASAAGQHSPAAPLSGTANDAPPSITPPPSRRERRMLWVAKALLLIRDHPDWTNKAVAEAVGISPSQLTKARCPEFHAAKALAIKAREEQLRGHVEIDKDTGRRTVEAHSTEDPAEMDWDDDRN